MNTRLYVLGAVLGAVPALVPCDPAAATCELTWWQCPENVKPLRA